MSAQDIMYSIYGRTSAQLLSTNQTILSYSSPTSKYCEAPGKLTPWLKTETSPLCESDRSLFLPGQFHLVSTSPKYLQQKVKHSSMTYASAIEPSGLAVFHT